MTKAATTWTPLSGTGEVSPSNEGDFLLLETGDNLLLETGDNALLEDNVETPKAATAWAGSDS
jgi:hypothetical protein